MTRRRRAGRTVAAVGALLVSAIVRGRAAADEASSLVKQANAPVSSIFQLRLVDSFLPQFAGTRGRGNSVTASVTMPLPAYRLLPRPQLSLLTLPAAVTTPNGTTGVGDLGLLDIVVLEAGHGVIWGVGPTFVLPTATRENTGRGQWQAGPAAALAFAPRRWLLGVVAQNPIAFAGEGHPRDANALFLQPFLTYQLRNGWFLRSQPQMRFDWETGRYVVPIDLGGGRVFELGHRLVNCFVEPFWNAGADRATATYGISFGISLLYPDFWNAR